MCCSASGECNILAVAEIYPPSSVAVATASPQGEAFLQESFRATQQGDEREQYCPPSSVAFGATFPFEGKNCEQFVAAGDG